MGIAHSTLTTDTNNSIFQGKPDEMHNRACFCRSVDAYIRR